MEKTIVGLELNKLFGDGITNDICSFIDINDWKYREGMTLNQ